MLNSASEAEQWLSGEREGALKKTDVDRKGGKKRRHAEKARGCTGREDVSRETHGRAKQRDGKDTHCGGVIPVLEFKVTTQ